MFMKFHIALPDTLLSDCTSLREKTEKLGIISRALALFKVEAVNLYRDPLEEKSEYKFIKKILEYQNTPQYLRKKVFKREEDLKFVGLLPPLRTPHHKLKCSLKDIKEGEIRQGYVFKKGKEFYVDVGLEKPFLIKEEVKEGEIINVKFFGVFPNFYVKKISKEEIKEYWGYEVKYFNSLKSLLENYKNSLIFVTSKYGKNIVEDFLKLINELKKKELILILFGSPKKGLLDMMKKEGISFKSFLIYNMVPDQGTETVRVEEALISSLAILNVMIKF